MEIPNHFTKAKIEDVAKNFFGCGNFDAPNVFVGIEWGGSGSKQEFNVIYQYLTTHLNENNSGVVDFTEYLEYLKFAYPNEKSTQWITNNSTQRTYTPLVKLVSDCDARYSDICTLTNSNMGKNSILFLELFGLPCRSVSEESFSKYAEKLKCTKEVYRDTHFLSRCERLQDIIFNRKDKRKVVIFYGLSHEWDLILPEKDRYSVWQIKEVVSEYYRWKKLSSGELVLVIRHPTSHFKKGSSSSDYFNSIKSFIKKKIK